MSPLDDDRPAWIPVQAPRTIPPTEPPPAAPPPPTSVPDEPREGEGVLRPRQAPAETAPLNAADWKQIRADEARQAAEESRRLEEMLAEETALIHLPAFLTHPLVLAGLLGVMALVGLFVFAQVTSTLAGLATLPEWVRYPGYAGLAILTLLVLFAAFRLLGFYFSLRPNRPVPVKTLQQLAQRTRLRWLVQEKAAEAREHLAGYMRLYPFTSDKERKALGFLGLTAEHFTQMETARQQLLDANLFASSDTWFNDFRERFQKPLDEVAEGRIVYYARRVAFFTAASPNALVDTLLTGYCSFMLLADLCRIYNLRSSRLGTAILLTHVFFNAYMAGQLNELENVTSTGIEGLVTESGLRLGSMAADATLAKIAGKLGSRMASGVLNYFLLQRLGKYAVRLLRPVAVG